jgi:hypothetical protein
VADYIKTITVAVNVFGPEPTEKWSTSSTTSLALVWGQDQWGYGTVGLLINFTKGIFSSINSDSNIAKNIYYSLSNAVNCTTDSNIYKYREGYTVTYGGQAEIGLWPRATSYTIAAGTTTSWTAASAASGTWS